jgi:hypothetical protein
VRSGWIPQAGPVGRHERERRSQFLGRLSANPHSSDSTANSYGRYGSPNTGARSARDRSRMRDPQGDMSVSEGVNSSTSINNAYSTYGSPYSSQSPNNPYATQAPLLFGD